MSEDVKQAAEKVNLENLDASLSDETLELNPDLNPMEGPPPVADGVHRVKLVFDVPFQWERKETKKGDKYWLCKWYGVVVDDGPELNKRIFSTWKSSSTLPGFGGKPPEMAHILKMVWGNTAEAAAAIRAIPNQTALAQEFQKALAGEPIIRIETKWVASYANPDKEAKNRYPVALSGQRNFPLVDSKDANKGRRPVTNVEGVGEVGAKAEIQNYFPDLA